MCKAPLQSSLCLFHERIPADLPAQGLGGPPPCVGPEVEMPTHRIGSSSSRRASYGLIEGDPAEARLRNGFGQFDMMRTWAVLRSVPRVVAHGSTSARIRLLTTPRGMRPQARTATGNCPKVTGTDSRGLWGALGRTMTNGRLPCGHHSCVETQDCRGCHWRRTRSSADHVHSAAFTLRRPQSATSPAGCWQGMPKRSTATTSLTVASNCRRATMCESTIQIRTRFPSWMLV
jgi:hypothetical protein